MAGPDSNRPCAEKNFPLRYAWLGLAVVAAAFGLAATLTWRKWPDLLVDFGTQLYMPWRIANGAVLYRDLFYFSGGPFSQYFNALLFKIFGVSFSTLIAANLIFAAAMVVVIYRGFVQAANVGTATMIGLGVVLVFVFGQYTLGGNYNYLTPYTQESTHGLIFSIGVIALLADWIKLGRIWRVLAAGFLGGLVFLTKPDIFLALTLTVIAGFVLARLTPARINITKSLAAFLFMALLPPFFFFLFFLRVEKVGDSLRSVGFDWVPVFQGSIAKNSFYRWCTGLDDPATHLRNIILSFLAVALAGCLYACVFRWVKNLNSPWVRSKRVMCLLLIFPLLVWAVTFDWRQCGWPLPLLVFSACVLLAWNYKKLEPPPVFPLLWSIFSLLLLAKLGLFPRVWHYGFALAMPAFVSSIYLLVWLLPLLLEKKFGVPSRDFRMMTGLVLLVGFGNLFDQSQLLYAKKTLRIGAGGDQIITYDDPSRGGPATAAALAWTQTNLPPGATLGVLPDAIIFNYLTRHPNSTPCLFWDPNSLGVYGQSNFVAAFEKNPPDYIFIVQRDSSEFGKGYFGSSPDFGQDLMLWVQKNYSAKILFGSEPLKSPEFGIKILKYSPPSSSALVSGR